MTGLHPIFSLLAGVILMSANVWGTQALTSRLLRRKSSVLLSLVLALKIFVLVGIIWVLHRECGLHPFYLGIGIVAAVLGYAFLHAARSMRQRPTS